MSNFSGSTIEKYPGSVRDIYPEIPEEVFTKVYRQLTYDKRNSKDFNLFVEEYVKNNVALVDVPKKTGIPECICSAWASDVIPTIKGKWVGYKSKPERDRKESIHETAPKTVKPGFDIFDHARKFNADYYDYHTGYIYHIQEYNRANSFGLPTPGIRVSENGRTIGYVKEGE